MRPVERAASPAAAARLRGPDGTALERGGPASLVERCRTPVSYVTGGRHAKGGLICGELVASAPPHAPREDLSWAYEHRRQ